MLNYKQIYSACLILVVFISGCSTWKNFTTYFNVYYNAKLSYDEAMEDISKNEKDIFEFKEKPVSATADKALTKVIEKCSAILQYNAESAYFDDALFIIGVAYYYKQNYSKAIRKFRELEAVENTDLSLENKLWIGKTELQLRNFEEGINQLEEVKKLAAGEEHEEILEAAYQSQIAFNFFQENYETAVQIINDFLAESQNEETKAEVAFQLGKIYLELNNPNKAADAFSSVSSYSPTIKTEFQSKLELAKTESQLEEYEKSIEILEELKAEDKFMLYLDEILYEQGVVYFKQENLDEAIENFSIVDTMKSVSRKETIGLSRIKLAEIWEYDYMDYDSAAKYYNRAASSVLTPEEKSYSISKLTLFNNYKALKKNIFLDKRQIAYINNPEEFVKDSIDYEDYLFDLRADSLKNASSTSTANDNRANEQDRARDLQGNKIREDRRAKPERSKLSLDSLLTIASKAEYDLGNMFFIEMDVPDSAYFYYKNVLDNYPKRPFTPSVIFALGSYYLSVEDTVSADSIFQYIYDEYQGLAVAEQAARRLGILEFDVETDTSAQFYLDAEEKLLSKNYGGAIEDFYTLADRFPESVLAPKALYSVGWILENELNKFDSAAVVYDTLNTRYEKSLYAKEIQAKLQEYKQEMLKKKLQDSSDSKTAEEEIKTDTKKDSAGANKVIEKINENKDDETNKIKDSIPIQDTTKSPQELRKEIFLKEEKERLNIDSSKSGLKSEPLEDVKKNPDSTAVSDSSKPVIKELLK